MQQNGTFFSVADMVEDADDLYLERAGLNAEGALYKPESSILDFKGPNILEKKTRKEEGIQDFNQLIDGLDQEAAEDRWDYIYDNVDIPMTINTLAGLVVVMQTDMFSKNYYVYRDTGGDNEWAILPWDLDLSFGRKFTSRGRSLDGGIFHSDYTEFFENGRIATLVRFFNPRGRGHPEDVFSTGADARGSIPGVRLY